MVSIIIINYFQKELLLQCLSSIYKCISSYPFEIIIVNNSTGQKLDEISSEFPDTTIIPNENRGFSQANNLAAGRSKGEYLLFLNADTIFQNDFLKDLISSAEKIKFGAIGLKLYNSDGTFQLSFWKENNFFNEISNKKSEQQFAARNKQYMNAIEDSHKELSEVEWVTGASLFVKKEIYNEVGGYDEDYFLFYEDADLCRKFMDHGYKIYFFPGSRIIHLKGENANPSYQSSTYYFVKDSQLLYYNKHADIFNRILLRIYLFFRFLLLSLLTFKKINFKILGRVLSFR